MARPTKYRKEFCELLISHMEQGLSFESFGGVARVTKDTLYQWVKRYPEFSDSKKIGTELSRLFWEKVGVRGSVGKLPGFNNASWIFNMKNRFNWRDRLQFEDVTKIPDKELIEKAKKMLLEKEN